jgi:hypothetical protein
MLMLTEPLYVPAASPEAFTLTETRSFPRERLPVDGLTLIHEALLVTVHFFDTIEFLLNVIVCDAGTGLLADAL